MWLPKYCGWGREAGWEGSFSLSLSGSDILQFSPHSVHPELATERYYKGGRGFPGSSDGKASACNAGGPKLYSSIFLSDKRGFLSPGKELERGKMMNKT